jgi:transposase
MKRQGHFRPYEPNQLLFLPPDMRTWLPEDDLVYFIMDVVRGLELSAIYQEYDGTRGGQPPYDPRMMAGLLLYAYCVGVFSSRKIEKVTYHSVPFRVLCADQHPDHDTIAEFRRRHLKALSGLFVQVLRLCQKMGMVKLSHVALDGTKVRANASKHKAMSYGRMENKAQELEEEVARLLAEAQAVDAAEDARYGKGKRGDELPGELRFKQSRLKKIKEAMQALEQEAKAEAQERREEIRRQQEAKEKEARDRNGRKPKEPSSTPDPRAQRNFSDPESRIMKEGATGSFEQCYNCQTAVDEKAQVIVAATVSRQPTDKQQLKPVLEKLKENTADKKPKKLSADAGFFSEANATYCALEGIDAYLATQKHRHNKPPEPAPRGRIPRDATVKDRMARKLRTIKGRCTYTLRKQIVEPVFGQIKEVRGFRRFLMRGLEQVHAEWELICLTHNLLKLFRSGLALERA